LRITQLSRIHHGSEAGLCQKMNRDLAAHIVAEHRLIGNDGVNRPALQEVFHYMMVVNPAIEVYLLDPAGLILADAAPPGKVKRPDVSVARETWKS